MIGNWYQESSRQFVRVRQRDRFENAVKKRDLEQLLERLLALMQAADDALQGGRDGGGDVDASAALLQPRQHNEEPVDDGRRRHGRAAEPVQIVQQPAHQLLLKVRQLVQRQTAQAELVAREQQLRRLLRRAAVAADQPAVDQRAQLVAHLRHVAGHVAGVERRAHRRRAKVRRRLPVEHVQHLQHSSSSSSSSVAVLDIILAQSVSTKVSP